MSDARSQSTLREWRAHLTHPLTLTALGGVSLILGLVGPFGTLQGLSFIERLAYWTFLTVSGYVVGYLISQRLLKPLPPTQTHIGQVLLAGIATGTVMTALVTGLNWLVFDFFPPFSDWQTVIGTTLGISVVVMFVIDQFVRHFSSRPAPAVTEPPRLLSRLPFDKRAALVAVSVEDHYVRVRTLKGEEMLLMRLSDAIAEVGDTAGAQVHRSHWAAFDQVRAVRREGDRAILQMSTGADIPVSRANVPKLRDAGLLV